MRQDIIDLYDAYTHERLDRRIFMDRLAKLAGGSAAAAALLPCSGRTMRRRRSCRPTMRASGPNRSRFKALPARCRRIWSARPMPRARSPAWS